MTLNLGKYEETVKKRLDLWEKEDFSHRLWKKDPTLWFSEYQPEITDRLGWLDLPQRMREKTLEIVSWARQTEKRGLSHVVLLGMGGSSLAADVFQKIFPPGPDFPELIILDSTHPSAVRKVEKKLDLPHTLFIVSSKSGTTIETLCLFQYFWDKMKGKIEEPGRLFVAITDSGSPLERRAREKNFLHTFLPPSDVGGRFSAFTEFGLVPAALIGLDIHGLLEKGRLAADKSGPGAPVKQNPGLVLGAVLGELAPSRDKLTILTSPSLTGFSAWLEQLIAESTGKASRGIVPVVEEPLGPPEIYGQDRVFVAFLRDGESVKDLEKHLQALEASGQPVIRFPLREELDLGQEIFRWELGVAAAGSILGIHPFNQPDVRLAKDLTRQAMEKNGKRIKGARGVDEAISIEEEKELASRLKAWLSSARPGDYISLQAYLAPSLETTRSLENIRSLFFVHTHLATTVGYGPRFLHSTGQLHKGGANSVLVLQLVDEPDEDFPVPETDFSFASLIKAQALGDYHALLQRERRVLRVNIKDAFQGLKRLESPIQGAVKANPKTL